MSWQNATTLQSGESALRGPKGRQPAISKDNSAASQDTGQLKHAAKQSD